MKFTKSEKIKINVSEREIPEAATRDSSVYFLLNKRILDIGVPAERVVELFGAETPRFLALTPRGVVKLGQDLFYSTPPGAEPSLKSQESLACLIAITIGADGALFVTPDNAQSPEDVGTRFADIDLRTLFYLHAMQASGDLTARLANEAVWSQPDVRDAEDEPAEASAG